MESVSQCNQQHMNCELISQQSQHSHSRPKQPCSVGGDRGNDDGLVRQTNPSRLVFKSGFDNPEGINFLIMLCVQSTAANCLRPQSTYQPNEARQPHVYNHDSSENFRVIGNGNVDSLVTGGDWSHELLLMKESAAANEAVRQSICCGWPRQHFYAACVRQNWLDPTGSTQV